MLVQKKDAGYGWLSIEFKRNSSIAVLGPRIWAIGVSLWANIKGFAVDQVMTDYSTLHTIPTCLTTYFSPKLKPLQ